MNNAVTILVVDDDEIDIEGVRRGFARQSLPNPIRVAYDAKEALDLLRERDPNRAVRRPFLILLDINMPRMSGIEFLDEIRKDPALCDSVIFMLTTSDAERDVLAAYSKNVAGYLVKSNVGAGFSQLVQLLDYYCRYVEFPPEKRVSIAA